MKNELDIAEDDPQGLTDREYTLLARLHKIVTLLAKHDRAEVADLIMEEFSVDADDAEKWIVKSEDFLALGVLDSAADARRIYHMRLMDIYNLCMDHAVVDQVEQITKPVKMKVETTGENDETIVSQQIVNAVTTKVKPNSLNVGAVTVAMKAAREAAHIGGGRPRDPKSINVAALQINQGLPSAQLTQDLGNDQLADLLGLEVIDAEPQAGSQPVLPQPAENTAAPGIEQSHGEPPE